MNYREALAWLFGTQLFGIKLGLENIEHLLGELDVPALGQRIIHVAGTNGKGSVCAMIDSIVRAAGYRTALFTSPHLVTFRERIQVNGEMISREEVARGLTSLHSRVRDANPHPTFFEITTALALQHFQQSDCELIVLETGMGGRLDATNAVMPIVSVITPIGFDHEKWLGHSLGEIAREKAGIIKPRVPVISAPQLAEAADVIRETAEQLNSPLRVVKESYAGTIALAGPHQKQNAAVAIAAIRAADLDVSDASVEAGVTSVTWPARFQRWDKRLVIDGAHNPAGAHVLAETWREMFGDLRATIVLAILRDKNAAGIVRALAPIASRFVVTKARSERALAATELAQIIRKNAPGAAIASAESFEEAMRITATDPHVLITGSLHFAGEALAHLRGTPDELDECLQ